MPFITSPGTLHVKGKETGEMTNGQCNISNYRLRTGEEENVFIEKKHYSGAVLIQLQRACRLFVRVTVKFRVRVRVSVRARFTFRVWVRVRVRARARARVGVGFSSYSSPHLLPGQPLIFKGVRRNWLLQMIDFKGLPFSWFV